MMADLTGGFDMISSQAHSDERSWWWANLAMLVLASVSLVVFMTV